MFAVRFSSGARQTTTLPCVFRTTHVKQKHTVSVYFAVRFSGGARQSQIFAVRFPRDARQLKFTNGRPFPTELTGGGADGRQALPCAFEKRTAKTTSLPCVFLWRTAKLQHCRAFFVGARQCIFKN
jgi:hypothetical protein